MDGGRLVNISLVETKKYVDVLVKGIPKKIEVQKISKWVCHDCGKETLQPEGKVIEYCEPCGTTHSFLVQPDGMVIEYVRAEGWFLKEFEDHAKDIHRLDIEFKRSAFQLVRLQKQVNELADKLEYAEKVKMKNIIEGGLKRHKLLRRQDMNWQWNPAAQRFMGVKKEEPKK